MSVTGSHQVVERDLDPLTIPPRPAPAAPDIEFHELPNRLWTYRVTATGLDGLQMLGYVRWDPNDVWIARTPGSAVKEATIKKFENKFKAAAWLQEHLARRRR